MKKIFFLLLLPIIFISCENIDINDDIYIKNTSNAKVVRKYSVSYNQMQTLLNIFDKDTYKTIESIKPIIYEVDTLMYIVNYKNNKGWKIISGDRRINPILAEDKTGTFSLENNNNPSVLTWLSQQAEQIYNHRKVETVDSLNENYKLWLKIDTLRAHTTGSIQKIAAPIENDGYWSLISITTEELPNTTTGHLTNTLWGQSYPWNNCVPWNRDQSIRCYAGCVAVAGAQVLYFLHNKIDKPSGMYTTGYCVGVSDVTGSLLNDYSNYYFSFSNWSSSAFDNMYSTSADYTWASIFGIPNENAAILIGNVGKEIGMRYSDQGSGASTSDLKSLFALYGISSTYGAYNSSIVEQNINNGLPTIVRATSKVDPIKFLGITIDYKHIDGHSWIIDGCEQKRIKYTYTYEWVQCQGCGEALPVKRSNIISPNDPYPYETKTTTSLSITKYFLMNWGWSGTDNDGLFLYDDNWYIDTVDKDGNPYTMNYKLSREMLYNFN